MTCDITIGIFKPFKPHAIKWVRKIDNYSDSAVIKVPAICRLKKSGDAYENVPTGLQIKEGMKVQIFAGYNGNNKLRFMGFVRRINFSIPLEIECEGYSYQLRMIKDFTKSYKVTTVLNILKDLVKGTDIKLSNKIPAITLHNIVFKNVTGTEVLDYLKKQCLLTCYFSYDELYVGLQQAELKGTVKHRLGWNVIKDNELKFDERKEQANVVIHLEKSQKTGTKKKAISGPKDGNIVTKKVRHIEDQGLLDALAKVQKEKVVQQGYEGKITTFLEPYAEPGMASNIDDKNYTERAGLFFIESVEGEYSTSGGRQKIGIGATLS